MILFCFNHSTECGYDYIYVYDGPSTESRLLGQICGEKSKDNFFTTSYYLTVRFRSDGIVNLNGFRAFYGIVCKSPVLLSLYTSM